MERVKFFTGLWNLIESFFIIISVFLLIIITLPVTVPVGIISMFLGRGIKIDRLIRRKRGKK